MMFVFEGNGIRPSHLGLGWKESEIMYTLNTTEVHAVAAPKRERESGCLRHRPSSVQLRSECPVRLSNHGRGEHSAESKRTECRGSSKEKQ